jgi:nucleotide-binding universal stress UspA family protein
MKRAGMKKILIALDFDPTAKIVAETGFKLSETAGAEVLLLHVVSDPIHYSAYRHVTVMGFGGYKDTAPLVLDGVKELKKESLRFLEKSKLHLGDEKIQIMVKEGDVAESILEAAGKFHADIIVIGSHSRKWLENIVMGSVAEKVLRETVIPVFIIPTGKKK